MSAYEGKALVNSVTGEDERLEAILPLVKKHVAAVVGVANDETGISNEPEVRLAVAGKIVSRAADHGTQEFMSNANIQPGRRMPAQYARGVVRCATEYNR